MAQFQTPHTRRREGMISIQPKGTADQPQRKTMETCKHLRVQIVAREEDSEFVECKDCGEIFESSEFKDMSIEEQLPAEE